MSRYFILLVAFGIMGCQWGTAQDRKIPGTPEQPDQVDRKNDKDSPDIIHPTPLNAGSRDINNVDPTIVPFEGEMPGPLGSGSREIGTPPQGTGPTIHNPQDILGGDSRSTESAGRAIGTIYQLPNGQLKFVISPVHSLGQSSRGEDRSFKGGKRGSDRATGTELVDPPVMTSGSYNRPLGRGSRDQGNPLSHPEPEEDSGFFEALPTGDPIKLSPDESSQLEKNSRALLEDEAMIIAEEDEDAGDVPSALRAGERGIDYQVSHLRNLTKTPIIFKAQWGNESWKILTVQPGKDIKSWRLPKKGLAQLTIRFDCDPGPGFNEVTYQVRTKRHPTSVINGKPTDVFVVLKNGQVDLRKYRP